jgi:hypothetical protein
MAELPPTPPDDRLMIDEREAERLTGLSGKTLKRLAERGELVGRVRVLRAVRFHVPTLAAWAAARAAITN